MTARTSAFPCDRARGQLSLTLDGELSPFEAAQLEAHLEQCASCRAYEAELGSITRLLRTTPLASPATPILMPRRRQALARRLQVGAAAAAFAVLALGGVFGLNSGSGVFLSTVGVQRQQLVLAGERPAYLDSTDYELRLIAQALNARAHPKHIPTAV